MCEKERFLVAFQMNSESVCAVISVVMDVQRTTLGLDAEKRPLPCRAHTEQAAGFQRNSAVFVCILLA